MMKCTSSFYLFFELLGELSLYGPNTQNGHDVEMTPAQLCTQSQLQMDFDDFTPSSTPRRLFSAPSFLNNVITQHRSQTNLSKTDRAMVYLLEEIHRKNS